MATAIALASRNCEAERPVKSISRILQHSILQLCNEHIGYSNKLQILGVLCMTIDDEQQELVVKVNNTLKRVSPALTGRETASKLPAVSQSNPHLPEPTEYDTNHEEDQDFTNSTTENANESLTIPADSFDLKQDNDQKKRRKRSKPVKVQNVYEDIDTEQTGQEDQDVITVFPTDPDSSQGAFSSDDSSPDAPSDFFKSHFHSDEADCTNRNKEGIAESSTKTRLYHNGSNFSDKLILNTSLMHPRQETYEEAEQLGMEDNDDFRFTKSGYLSQPGYKFQIKEESESMAHDPLDISLEDMLADNNGSNDSINESTSLHASHEMIDCTLPSQVPYESRMTSGCMGGTSDSELSIYTGANIHASPNCKRGNQSSRIKDIILYDNSSPISSQKGSRIEADFMLDQLGLEGRKRRRRAPDDSLTSEEIAEYMGQVNDAGSNFKCRFCTAEVNDLTKYLQHTLAAHNAYICHQCGKSFTTKSSLLRHRPIHTGMRRFACTICKKTFYRKDKCKAHIKRHLGVGSDQNVDKYQSIEPLD